MTPMYAACVLQCQSFLASLKTEIGQKCRAFIINLRTNNHEILANGFNYNRRRHKCKYNLLLSRKRNKKTVFLSRTVQLKFPSLMKLKLSSSPFYIITNRIRVGRISTKEETNLSLIVCFRAFLTDGLFTVLHGEYESFMNNGKGKQS